MSDENAPPNWPELVNDYNSVIGTSFETPKEMLKAVYAEKRTYIKTGKVFLLSSPTISKYMKRWGLEHLPSGHRGDSPCLRAIKGLGDVSNLTAKQIADKTGFSIGRVNALAKKHEIKYHKMRG